MTEESEVGYCIIPPHILVDGDLSANEKIIYGRVQGLTKERGYCYASNKWLSNQLDLSPGTVSNIISKLVDKGYMKRKIIRDENKAVKQRHLYPVFGGVPIEEWGGINGTVDRGINGSMEESSTDKRETEEIYTGEYFSVNATEHEKRRLTFHHLTNLTEDEWRQVYREADLYMDSRKTNERPNRTLFWYLKNYRPESNTDSPDIEDVIV